VAAFLSQDWLDLQRLASADELPGPNGASALVQVVVTGAPGGAVSYTTTVEQGRVVAGALGEPAGQPDINLGLAYADAVALAQGEVELSALFMQGKLKVEGDMRKVFALLADDHQPAARARIAELAAQTEF
jgi:hypothetical protein